MNSNTKTAKMEMTQMDFQNYFHAHEKELEKTFFEFLSMPTISADPKHLPELKKTAHWLQEYLTKIGFTAELWNDSNTTPPVVFASHKTQEKQKPTLLIYNHYDVQPVDPIEKWSHNPFTPKRNDNVITARGAQDNKGQCFYVLSALKAWWDHYQSFPMNIKLLIEGQEEVGSSLLNRLLPQKQCELKADYLLVVDLGMKKEDTPAITLGIRGIASMDVEVTGTTSDLHSGVHGGVAYNPLHALVKILSSLRDDAGKITVPEFYDDVEELSDEERKMLNFDFDEGKYIQDFGALPTGGEIEYPVSIRGTLRPTLEINGLFGGYSGPGCKTVIPSHAYAKLSVRLVSKQTPEKVLCSLKNTIENSCPKGVKVKCTIHEGNGLPILTSPNSKIVQALSDSCNLVYHKPCEFILEGGSIPIVANLQKASQSEVALFGLGLSSDNMHAPNEHFGWDRIENGFLIMLHLIENLAK